MPDSAGGVQVNISFQNATNDDIKYLTVAVDPYNAVGDVVESEIGGKTTATIKVTGPIAPGKTSEQTAGPVWYNATIRTLRVLSVRVDYMGGAVTLIDGASLTPAADGTLSDTQARTDIPFRTKAEREKLFLGQLRDDLTESMEPKLKKVPDKLLLAAGWRMCNAPGYDGGGFGLSEDTAGFDVELPRGVPEDVRVMIWSAVTMELCPV